MGIWNLIAADANGLEALIKIGLVILFMVGPYLLQLLGGKAVQNDRGNAGGNRRRETQSELEKEIADFLEQSRRGGSSPSRTPAESVESHTSDDFVVAETAPETLRDHHLAPSPIESQSFSHLEGISQDQEEVFTHTSATGEEFRYEEPEKYNYDSDQKTESTSPAASIAAMFREPEKVRNAFILGEIMNRPKLPRRS